MKGVLRKIRRDTVCPEPVPCPRKGNLSSGNLPLGVPVIHLKTARWGHLHQGRKTRQGCWLVAATTELSRERVGAPGLGKPGTFGPPGQLAIVPELPLGWVTLRTSGGSAATQFTHSPFLCGNL